MGDPGLQYDPVEESLFPPGGLLACRYCGEEGLHWERFMGRWRLANGSLEVHECREYKKARMDD